jgi:hypothetical protein
MSNIALQVENLYRQYKIGAGEVRNSLKRQSLDGDTLFGKIADFPGGDGQYILRSRSCGRDLLIFEALNQSKFRNFWDFASA